MTLEEQLLQRGRQEGRQEGMLQGRRAVLVDMLREKFGPLDPRFIERIESADSEALTGYAKRFVTVSTLEELFPG